MKQTQKALFAMEYSTSDRIFHSKQLGGPTRAYRLGVISTLRGFLLLSFLIPVIPEFLSPNDSVTPAFFFCGCPLPEGQAKLNGKETINGDHWARKIDLNYSQTIRLIPEIKHH